MSAALPLRRAVRIALGADPAWLALLGAPSVYDQPPPNTDPPYLLLGDHVVRDASSGGAPAEEHEIALEIWSEQAGLKEALVLAEAAIAALRPETLAVPGQHLVQFAWTSTDARREARGRLAVLRFRALTEPA